MELNQYQKRAMETCMQSCDNFSYMMLNLVGEIGEFAGKIAKQIRKENMAIINGQLIPTRNYQEMPADIEEELKKEAGDILWQLSGLCTTQGWSLDDIAQMNLDKLSSRKARGVIDGNGDNR